MSEKVSTLRLYERLNDVEQEAAEATRVTQLMTGALSEISSDVSDIKVDVAVIKALSVASEKGHEIFLKRVSVLVPVTLAVFSALGWGIKMFFIK